MSAFCAADCDENSDDELRLHLAKEDCHKTAGETSVFSRLLFVKGRATRTYEPDIGLLGLKVLFVMFMHNCSARRSSGPTNPITMCMTYAAKFNLKITSFEFLYVTPKPCKINRQTDRQTDS